MQAYLTLVRRELGSFFLSWAGYTVIAGVVFLVGLSFSSMLRGLNAQATAVPLTQLFYQTPYFWCILGIVAPLLTMRSLAWEKSSGTYETLMTTPVGDAQVVLAKFTGAMLCYLVLWLPLVGCILIVRHYSRDASAFDAGAIASTYLGIFLIGAMAISLGILASAITKSQIIAAAITLAAGLTLFVMSFLSATASKSDLIGQLAAHVALIEHMRDFAHGMIDTRPLVLYSTLTAFFLFLSWKVVESRRWK